MKAVKSSVEIVDPNLCAWIWVNLSGEMHWFDSYLEKRYPGASGLLVANPSRVYAPHGERTLVPHAYFYHWNESGRPMTPSCGRVEIYDSRKHAYLLAEFMNRLGNPSDTRVQ